MVEPKVSGEASDAPAPFTRTASAKPCATCGKPQTAAYKPFCSKRCADVDLARWLKGSYAIPGAREVEGEDDDDR